MSTGIINIPKVTGDIVIMARATIISYSVTNNLTDVTNNNSYGSIKHGSSYNAVLTAEDNYSVVGVTVTMGGVDITSEVYSNGSINILEVTGDIVITASAGASLNVYTVTNNLTNAETNNSNTTVQSNSSYSSKLIANSDYTFTSVVITMGGTDITSSVYTCDGEVGDLGEPSVIFIPEVTGDIVITAVASTIDPFNASGVEWATGYYLDDDGTYQFTISPAIRASKINISGYSTIYSDYDPLNSISTSINAYLYLGFYDKDNVFMEDYYVKHNLKKSYIDVTVPDNAVYAVWSAEISTSTSMTLANTKKHFTIQCVGKYD